MNSQHYRKGDAEHNARVFIEIYPKSVRIEAHHPDGPFFTMGGSAGNVTAFSLTESIRWTDRDGILSLEDRINVIPAIYQFCLDAGDVQEWMDG